MTGLFFSTALTLSVVPATWLALARRREPREAHAAGAAPAVIRSAP